MSACGQCYGYDCTNAMIGEEEFSSDENSLAAANVNEDIFDE